MLWTSSNPLYNPVVFREAVAPVLGEAAMAHSPRNLRWKASHAVPQMILNKQGFPACPICNRPVDLESAKADENGHAIHEECYLLRLRMEQQGKSA